MEDDLTMAMIDGVLVRSYWLAEDDEKERLRRGVNLARDIATSYGEEVHSVDVDPMSDDEDVLRVHIHIKRDNSSLLAHVPLRDEGGQTQATVYRLPD